MWQGANHGQSQLSLYNFSRLAVFVRDTCGARLLLARSCKLAQHKIVAPVQYIGMNFTETCKFDGPKQ